MIDGAWHNGLRCTNTSVDRWVAMLGSSPMSMTPDDDDVHLAALPVRRRDALRHDGAPTETPREFFKRRPSVNSRTHMLYALGLVGVVRMYTHPLESRDPALRRRILALHVVHVYRFVLALIVEPAAQQAAHFARSGNAAKTAAAAQPVALRITDALGYAANDAAAVASSALRHDGRCIGPVRTTLADTTGIEWTVGVEDRQA
jgi:hypothetical protein